MARAAMQFSGKVVVVTGAGRAFWMPTGQAITPKLVPPEDFPGAVAINSALFQTAAVGGPARPLE